MRPLQMGRPGAWRAASGLVMARVVAPVVALIGSAPAHADQALWEAGAGAAYVSVPHYRGSDQNHSWLLPVPYFVYRGKILRSDREGTRAVLLDTESVDFDVSLDASPPLKSSDNRARTGMTDLAATLEVGPRLNLVLGKGSHWKLDLRVPVRGAFAVGSHSQAIGWTATPVLNLDMQVQGWNLGVQGGPQIGSRRYNGYFYDVAPAYATADRPGYTAGGGAGGWGATVAASRRLGDWWVAAYARADTVSGAAFRDSPLVKQRSNTSFGFAASWVFKQSETRVADSR